MAEHEKQAIRNMAEAIATLSDEKKQYFIGFAEGVAAMADPVGKKASDGIIKEEPN